MDAELYMTPALADLWLRYSSPAEMQEWTDHCLPSEYMALTADVAARLRAIAAMGPSGSVIDAIEPTSLETLTIRAAGARRSSGSIALVTATTPNTLVSYTVRIVASVVWLGAPLPSPRAIPVSYTHLTLPTTPYV